MLTNEEFEKLGERVKNGKAWIEANGGWGGKKTPPFDYTKHQHVCEEQVPFHTLNQLQKSIRRWHYLSNEWLKEAQKRNYFGAEESQNIQKRI